MMNSRDMKVLQMEQMSIQVPTHRRRETRMGQLRRGGEVVALAVLRQAAHSLSDEKLVTKRRYLYIPLHCSPHHTKADLLRTLIRSRVGPSRKIRPPSAATFWRRRRACACVGLQRSKGLVMSREVISDVRILVQRET